MIFEYLLEVVKQFAPEDALDEFKVLFIEYRAHKTNANAFGELSRILTDKDYDLFINTLKRSCYILINNWSTNRQLDAIPPLVRVFRDIPKGKIYHDRRRQRLMSWLEAFRDSENYDDLCLFASRHSRQVLSRYAGTEEEETKPHWSERYRAYLLAPQYANTDNSPEQRQAARTLAHELRDQFKFDLAMYTARSQSAVARQKILENPTGLGDEVLRMIKKIVARKGTFSYSNLAHIFLKQIEGLIYKNFKIALHNYLIFSVDHRDIAELFDQRLLQYINSLYVGYDRVILDSRIFLRTINRVVDGLTTEDGATPSELFVFLLTQGKSLTLVMMLLKLILASPNSRVHLETRIAGLIKYYMTFPEEDCQWVVHFFEIFNIAFAIHGDGDVQYNLIRVTPEKRDKTGTETESSWDRYQIFSQHREYYTNQNDGVA